MSKSDQEFKADGGKSNPLLLEQGFPNALEHVNRTLDYGAIKYEAHSWWNVPNGINRYDAAARRHRRERDKGHMTDDESHLMHRAHEIVCLLMAYELELDAMWSTGVDVSAYLRFNPAPPQNHKVASPNVVASEDAAQLRAIGQGSWPKNGLDL